MLRFGFSLLLCSVAGAYVFNQYGWFGVHLVAGGFGIGYATCLALVWDRLR